MKGSILITGATGTVGRAASEYLSDHGYRVLGTGRSIEEDELFDRVEALDLLEQEDVETLEQLIEEEDVDVIMHLAWNVSEENFDTGRKWQGNMEMFENVLEIARETETEAFINGSSVHAGTGDVPAYTAEASLEDTPEPYRSSIDPEKDYDMRKQDPEKLLDPRIEKPDSPYGESKIETENRTREAVVSGDLRIGLSLRIGGVNPKDEKEIEGEPYYSSLYYSHVDLGRTIARVIDADPEKRQGYYQMYGVSDNPGRIFNIENPFVGR